MVPSLYIYADCKQLQAMEQILDRLESFQNWKELMRAACRQNGLSTSLAGDLTILKLKMLDERFKKSYATLGPKISSSWIENELRAFNWILIALSVLDKTLIADFGEAQWKLLLKVFTAKELSFLKFEARRLIQCKSKKNKNWSEEEEQLLTQEAQKFQSGKVVWNEVAHRMFQASRERVFRSGKHCREHWLNYLDPNKQRGAWLAKQDLFLLDKVTECGKKWSQLATLLKRTQHTVKNRFNSLLIKQKKLTPLVKKEERLIKQLRDRIAMAVGKDVKAESQRQDCGEQMEICEENVQQGAQEAENQQIKFQGPNESNNLQQQNARYIPLPSEQRHPLEPPNKVQHIQVQNPLSNYSPAMIPNCDLNFFIKQDNSQLKKTVFSEFPIYSPYSPYIISPNTPNYLSPASVYVNNSQFYTYFSAFMNVADISKEEDKGKQ